MGDGVERGKWFGSNLMCGMERSLLCCGDAWKWKMAERQRRVRKRRVT